MRSLYCLNCFSNSYEIKQRTKNKQRKLFLESHISLLRKRLIWVSSTDSLNIISNCTHNCLWSKVQKKFRVQSEFLSWVWFLGQARTDKMSTLYAIQKSLYCFKIKVLQYYIYSKTFVLPNEVWRPMAIWLIHLYTVERINTQHPLNYLL